MTLKSAVDVEVTDESGNTIETRRYGNLIKETVFKATQELMRERNDGFCLSVFKDNALKNSTGKDTTRKG